VANLPPTCPKANSAKFRVWPSLWFRHVSSSSSAPAASGESSASQGPSRWPSEVGDEAVPSMRRPRMIRPQQPGDGRRAMGLHEFLTGPEIALVVAFDADRGDFAHGAHCGSVCVRDLGDRRDAADLQVAESAGRGLQGNQQRPDNRTRACRIHARQQQTKTVGGKGPRSLVDLTLVAADAPARRVTEQVHQHGASCEVLLSADAKAKGGGLPNLLVVAAEPLDE
jgi:hypothetical protein